MERIEIKASEGLKLLYHFSVMRNEVKKGFKRTYGRKEGKEKLKLYDDTFERIQSISGDSNEIVCVSLSDKQHDMFFSFLCFYVQLLSDGVEKDNLSEDQEKELVFLKSMLTKQVA